MGDISGWWLPPQDLNQTPTLPLEAMSMETIQGNQEQSTSFKIPSASSCSSQEAPRWKDGSWTPWMTKPDSRPPPLIPEDKVGRFVVCEKHNKMRIAAVCEKVKDADGKFKLQCKPSDQCFMGDPGVENPTPSSVPNSRRYFAFKFRDNEPPRVCWSCGSLAHEAPQCPVNICQRCFTPTKDHVGALKLCTDVAEFDVCKLVKELDAGHLLDLACIYCGESGHADCSKPLPAGRKYCISCGNIGHHGFECSIRLRILRQRRERAAKQATGDFSSPVGYRSESSPGRGCCFRCGQSGHIARDCPEVQGRLAFESGDVLPSRNDRNDLYRTVPRSENKPQDTEPEVHKRSRRNRGSRAKKSSVEDGQTKGKRSLQKEARKNEGR